MSIFLDKMGFARIKRSKEINKFVFPINRHHDIFYQQYEDKYIIRYTTNNHVAAKFLIDDLYKILIMGVFLTILFNTIIKFIKKCIDSIGITFFDCFTEILFSSTVE